MVTNIVIENYKLLYTTTSMKFSRKYKGMIKMCLNLKGSQYKSISEVEHLMNNGIWDITEEKILEMKDNREEIENTLDTIDELELLQSCGL